MIKVYTYDYHTACVVERECETFGYPNRCTNGETMYENSHFLTPREAWDKLVREIEAGMGLDASEREQARRRFDKATTALADAAERLVRLKQAGPPEDAK